MTRKVPSLGDDDVVHWDVGEPEERDPVYLPVGTFCTAYARDTLIRAILANRDRFVYCDTDSMHLRGTWAPTGIRLDDRDLCAWKVEGEFWRARHLRPKCYIWDLNHRLSVTCAGMPDNVKRHCDFSNFEFGYRNYDMIDGVPTVRPGEGKLVPKSVPGGVVLVDGLYVLREM